MKIIKIVYIGCAYQTMTQYALYTTVFTRILFCFVCLWFFCFIVVVSEPSGWSEVEYTLVRNKTGS